MRFLYFCLCRNYRMTRLMSTMNHLWFCKAGIPPDLKPGCCQRTGMSVMGRSMRPAQPALGGHRPIREGHRLFTAAGRIQSASKSGLEESSSLGPSNVIGLITGNRWNRLKRLVSETAGNGPAGATNGLTIKVVVLLCSSLEFIFSSALTFWPAHRQKNAPQWFFCNSPNI